MKNTRLLLTLCTVLALAALAVIVASASPLPVENQVTLTNPGVDTDLTGWRCLWGSCEWASNGRTTGAITITDNSSFIQYLETPLVGATYTMTIWARCETTTTVRLLMQNSFDAYLTCTPNWSALSASGVVNVASTGFWIIFYSGGPALLDDASLKYEDGQPYPTATPTPTPTPGPSRVYFTLSSGNKASLVYQWTFGGMAITAAILVFTVIFAAEWLYEIVYQLLTWRRM